MVAKKALPKTYKGKSTKPGGGGRFAKMKDELMQKGYSEESAERITAWRGRKKWGAKKMAQFSAQGRKRKG